MFMFMCKPLSRVRLCNFMDFTVHGILQARILEWVAFPLSRGFSQPRDRTRVSRIAGGFFTNWATQEAQPTKYQKKKKKKKKEDFNRNFSKDNIHIANRTWKDAQYHNY